MSKSWSPLNGWILFLWMRVSILNPWPLFICLSKRQQLRFSVNFISKTNLQILLKYDEEESRPRSVFIGDALKKIGDLMKDMGFNPNASESAKEAFLKYLIKNATGHNVQTPTEKQLVAENPEQVIPFPQQLRFDFDDVNQQDVNKARPFHKRKL